MVVLVCAGFCELCWIPLVAKLVVSAPPVTPALEMAIAEFVEMVSGAAVTDVRRVVGSVGLSCAIDFILEAVTLVVDSATEDDEDADVTLVEAATTAEVEDAGAALLDVVAGATDFEELGAGVLTGGVVVVFGAAEDEVAPAPTATIGPDVANGATPADIPPNPTPRSVPVGSIPTFKSGDEVAPIPALIRGPELGAMATERGPIPRPSRAPPVEEAPEGGEVPRTGDRRPSAALPIPPNRPAAGVWTLSVKFSSLSVVDLL